MTACLFVFSLPHDSSVRVLSLIQTEFNLIRPVSCRNKDVNNITHSGAGPRAASRPNNEHSAGRRGFKAPLPAPL